MAKQSCKDHCRRVLCVPGTHYKWVHRNDGTNCDSYYMQGSSGTVFSRDFKESSSKIDFELLRAINFIYNNEAKRILERISNG